MIRFCTEKITASRSCLVTLVALIGFGKEALESFFGNVGGYAFGIEPFAGRT